MRLSGGCQCFACRACGRSLIGQPFLPRFGRIYCSAACGGAPRPGSVSSGTDWATDGDPEARDDDPAVLLEAPPPAAAAAAVDDDTLSWSVAGLRVTGRTSPAAASSSFDEFPYVVWQVCAGRTAAAAEPPDDVAEDRDRVPELPPSSAAGRKLICPSDYMLGGGGVRGSAETKTPSPGPPQSGGSDGSCRKSTPPPPPPPSRIAHLQVVNRRFFYLFLTVPMALLVPSVL